MIGDLLTAVVTMALLFVLAGLLRIRLGCGSHCDTCAHDCESDTEGRHP